MNDEHSDNLSPGDRLARLSAQLAQARNTSEMLRRTIIDVALDAVVTVDDSGSIVEFNRSAERMFGRRRRDVLGQPMADTIIPPQLRASHQQGMSRYLAGGRSRILGQRVELEAMHADGHVFPIELTVSEVKFAGHHLFTAFLRDLSEIKQAEREIARQREELHQREKLSALGSLLAGIAHELNNPLSVVVGRAILLEMKVRDPGLLKPLKEIRAAAERCARIVKTFLAMARQQQPERSPIQLNEIIHAALKLLDYPLHTSGIEVILDLQPELPQIPADASQIHQVYTNLLVNAQQALLERAAPRRLSITTRYDQRTGQLHSAVSDNGPGIPETVRSRIFDPFFTTKPIGYGTGVGLSFSHGVITAHGGTLNYEASPQGGAGFVIMLPLTAVATPAPAAGEPSVPTSRSLQVLIVDDEPEVTEIISDILQQSGHRTMLASSGKHALELLQQQHLFAFDVILSDLQMADINGPELYAQLQQQHPQLSGRIAFITGDTLGAAAAQFLRDSGCPYLEKPFTPAELEQLIATLAASS